MDNSTPKPRIIDLTQDGIHELALKAGETLKSVKLRIPKGQTVCIKMATTEGDVLSKDVTMYWCPGADRHVETMIECNYHCHVKALRDRRKKLT